MLGVFSDVIFNKLINKSLLVRNHKRELPRITSLDDEMIVDIGVMCSDEVKLQTDNCTVSTVCAW